METRSNHRVRFKSFELDLSTRELRRRGLKIRLQGQPVEVLMMLLERPGEVVTREQMRRRLWPEDTFVDFEHSLNTTIRRLREALGDSADDPRFIETLPRLGYRFIGPVEAAEVAPIEVSLGASTPNGKNGHVTESVLTAELLAAESAESLDIEPELLPELVAVTPPSRLERSRWVLVGTAAIAAVLAGGVAWYAHLPLPAPHITEVVQLTHDVGFQRKLVLGTDGAKVYLSLEPPAFGSVPVSGGDITIIPFNVPGAQPVFADCLDDVSPDGLSFIACGAIKDGVWENWIVGTSGTPVRYLNEAHDIGWSPDGKQVVYTDPHSNLYTMPSMGGDARLILRLNGDPGFCEMPHLVPGGRPNPFCERCQALGNLIYGRQSS